MNILPYKDNVDGGWYFDAPDMGVHREALIRGADAILDAEALRLSSPEKIHIEFSDLPISEASVSLVRSRPGLPSEEFGTWYRCDEYKTDVWLCDTLSLYFSVPPERLFVKARPSIG